MSNCCFHCHEPLPATPSRLRLDGGERAFCCEGCAGAALWIRDAGLAAYYRMRRDPAARAADDEDFGAWDRDEVQRELVVADGDEREATVLVDGMRCAACAWLIDRALSRMAGVTEVSANAITGRVRLRWRAGEAMLGALLARLAKLGFRPALAGSDAAERRARRERRGWLLRLGIAGIAAMQAMMFSEALYLDTAGEMPDATRDFFRWLSFLAATPVVFYSGWPFLAGAWREIAHRRLGMDTLIASATLLAYVASTVETLRGGSHVWFDAAVMFVFFLLVARFLDLAARSRARARIDLLARARPLLAERLLADGSEQVPVSALREGERVRVAAGAAVPADGMLLEAGSFDESLLSGEPEPVARRAGETVYAGSLCLGAPATVEITRTGCDTWLSQLSRLVERAQSARPKLARGAERVAARFVACLLVVSVLVFLAWLPQGAGRAFEVTLALLVVSCPCALTLAIPSALVAGHGALARAGVVAVAPDALETLARIDTLVFDKTGTLTRGRPQLQRVEAFGIEPARALAIAAALEAGSGHPLAAAFAEATGPGGPLARAQRVSAGVGVDGEVDGHHYRLGRAGFAAEDIADDGAVWLGDGSRALARFELADRLRDDAPAAAEALRRLGIELEIASGDAAAPVAATAGALAIGRFAARRTPGDKLARIRELQQHGHVVAMVGDGINDAPVLAGADVSLAMVAGAPLAQRSADLVVNADHLDRVPQAIALARRVRRVIRQNLGWAIGYNLLALPFAALGLVTPGLAAIGMAGSSLLVTLNALRLLRARDIQGAASRSDRRPVPRSRFPVPARAARQP